MSLNFLQAASQSTQAVPRNDADTEDWFHPILLAPADQRKT
jgi:hypothetical protein